MDKNSQYIKQRLSLREPLKESLDIVARLSKDLELKKEVDLEAELQKVQSLYPTCADFEREFPSLCFSIATGVGKTRLMGAFITYLYLEKGIRNFFILAPNLTIYEKLIKDFGEPGYEKYVFKGVAEFVHNQPLIITGDNYAQTGQLFSDEEIRINIFNISKFNRDATKATRGKEKGMTPRIKRLSEFLGQSYWDYLSNLDDLVVLMDEAHRYHADASSKAINELKPVLGLELTATPLDERGNSFKNVVYEYSLARALEDGKYVKNPAIATRKNFSTDGLTPKEIEQLKLEDAISIHKQTKSELEVYARNNNEKKVKPFVLVVCRDTTHAAEIYTYINSENFYHGEFKDKVLQIDSTTKKTEDIEKQFVELEQYDNDIEIVIHVNMLKEGWDVNNLYTIVPLRAANAALLIEQTIGRGLRLPYHGQRTGEYAVDKLTVIAHDNFDKVIEEAQKPESVLNKMSYITIDKDDIKERKEVLTSVSVTEKEIEKEQTRIDKIANEQEKQKANNKLDAKRALIYVLPSFKSSDGVNKYDDLNKPEVKQKAIEKVRDYYTAGQLNAFADELIAEAEASYDEIVSSNKKNIIEIPRIALSQGQVDVWFENFDLDTSEGFDYDILDEELMVVELTGERKTETIGVQHGAFSNIGPVSQVVSEIINFPEIDYDDNAELLHKLAKQAVEHLKSKVEDLDQLRLLVRQYRKVIAGRIYDQLKEHLNLSEPEYLEPSVLPFTRIEPWNFSVIDTNRRHYKDVISPKSLIPKLVFSGFEKACHLEYKFDSKTEQDFSYILENDDNVLKWLRPAPNQFRIYWSNNSKQYFPDFVVETDDIIYMVETKAADQLTAPDVLEKKKAALKYCEHASEFTGKNGGKPWKYLLIPHDEVKYSNSFDYLVKVYNKKA